MDPDIILSSDEVTLSSTTILQCITISFNGTRECTKDERNVTIMAKWRESEENNVTLYQQEATVFVTPTISKGIIIIRVICINNMITFLL